jgi:nucleoside-diphosphate-sugar epimerase
VRDLDGRTRQHIYVEDVADAVLQVINAPERSGSIYNVASGVALTAAEVAAEVERAVPGVELVADPTGAMPWGTFRLGPLDISAAREDLAWSPRISLEEGARRYARWLRERS